MERWQYEVTAGGRIWYCIDDDRRTVWVTDASVGHPEATEWSDARRESLDGEVSLVRASLRWAASGPCRVSRIAGQNESDDAAVGRPTE